jgi:large conductance mechanosensitive channel
MRFIPVSRNRNQKGFVMALPPVLSWVDEFRAFIARGSVVDLAVGVIIGAAFGSIVTSLVKDVLNPIIGVFLGGVDFSNIFIPLNGKHYDTLELARTAGAPTVNIGLFINAVIQFLIMALVIFWVVKGVSKLNLRNLGAATPPDTKTEVLLTEIRDLLKQEPTASDDQTRLSVGVTKTE